MKDLSLHILDIMQNSASAGACNIQVDIRVNHSLLEIIVTDNGCGMDPELLAVVTDPYTTTRTTRKIGLGIPLFKASAELSGGSFGITSEKGAGTVVKAVYSIQNIDRPPLGDIAGVITDMAAANLDLEIRLQLGFKNKSFNFDSRQVRQRLGEVSLTEPAVLQWVREYIGEGIKEIFGGVLSEIAG